MGWSDPARDPAAKPWEELHALLQQAGEKPPYVLVGASAGGIFVRLFAVEHPDEVAGLGLVDPATEDRMFTAFEGKPTPIASLTAEQLRTILPRSPVPVPRRAVQTGAPFNLLPPEIFEARKKLDARLIASIPELVPAEIVAASREAERARLARLRQQREERRHPLGDWPLVVLTRGVDENPELAAVHSGLARLSTNSRHTVVAGAGRESTWSSRPSWYKRYTMSSSRLRRRAHCRSASRARSTFNLSQQLPPSCR
jgi:pimeloyl-ACP methyl ester carboxylesterase